MKRLFFALILLSWCLAGAAAVPASPKLLSPLQMIGAVGPWEVEEPVPYIVNGTETNYEIYKSAVGIMVDGSLCTASLIDPEVLLSAGHCVYLYENNQLVIDAVSDPGAITVKSGANILWGGTTIAKAVEVVKHSSWTGSINSWSAVDLSLIHLDRKVTTLTPFPIRVSPNEAKNDTGVIVGYGITSTNGTGSGIHRYGNTTILNIGNVMGKQNVIEIGNPAGACQGDSGGPFLTRQFDKDVVSGVASFVAGQCSATSGSYYTWVLPNRDWIKSVVIQFTGHGFVSEESCGDDNDVCAPGEQVDCDQVDEHYAASTKATCNEGCYWWITTNCVPDCGDGYVMSPEACDGDGQDCRNLGPYISGTTAQCKSDCSGYDTSVCTATDCGDGVKEGNEFCDTQIASCATLGTYPENYYARCNDECTGYLVSDCTSGAIVCGNGTIDPFEECDDSNTTSGDGCSSKCKNEVKPDADTVSSDDPATDDGAVLDGDGSISPDGTIDIDVATADEEPLPDDASPDAIAVVDADGGYVPECGNGVLDTGEECDDGNMKPGDGCDPDCTLPNVAPDTDTKPFKIASSDGCSCAVISF